GGFFALLLGPTCSSALVISSIGRVIYRPRRGAPSQPANAADRPASEAVVSGSNAKSWSNSHQAPKPRPATSVVATSSNVVTRRRYSSTLDMVFPSYGLYVTELLIGKAMNQ